MFIIKLANRRVESQPEPPGQCPRCGSGGLHKWGRPKVRRIVDIPVSEIRTQRYRCKNCHRTMTAKPVGVGRAARSHAFTALVGVLYALGLSHRGVETAMGLFGHHIDHVSGWRDIQRLGKAVRRRLRSVGAKVVGVDETWLKVKGGSRPVGVVVDVGGRTLNIELTGTGFDYESWFRSMADELGVEVVVTDDSTDYSVGVCEAGLSRQQCAAHMKRTLGRAKGRLPKKTRVRHKDLLDQLSEMVKDLPSDGARILLEWSTRGRLPDEMRWVVTHLLVKWRELTLHQRRAGAPNSTNWLEGRFGRIKPRYRATRGLKSDAGALNFMSVVCDALA